jgi:hypothetical protein
MTQQRTSETTRSVLVAALVWLLIAVGVGASGVIARLLSPSPQLILLGVTLALLVVVVGARPVRNWVLTVDARLLVAFHLTRFVGI